MVSILFSQNLLVYWGGRFLAVHRFSIGRVTIVSFRLRKHPVDKWADLNIGLQARVAKTASWNVRLLMLLATALVLVVFGIIAHLGRNAENRAV